MDLVAIVPYFIDLWLGDRIVSTQFIRVFRVFRMFKAEGRYVESFTLFDNVLRRNSSVLITTAFVGATVSVLRDGQRSILCSSITPRSG